VSADAECSPQQDEGGVGTMLLVCQCPAGTKCLAVGEGGGAETIRGFNSALLIIGVSLVTRCFRG
jgi:hypothetical protein